MKRVALCFLLASLPASSLALAAPASLTAEAVNEAQFPGRKKEGIDPVILKAQVLLDRQRFSPGVIDGRDGDNLRKAIAAFEAAQGLSADGKLDEESWAKLTAADGEPVLATYEIVRDDVDGPFVKSIPKSYAAKSRLARLAYTGPQELLTEKFHIDAQLLRALNPGARFDRAGTKIVVPSVAARDKDERRKEKAASIEVDTAAGLVRVTGKDGKILATYPASVGSEEKPAPSGTFAVRAIAENPVYTYDPAFRFKGVDAKEKLRLPPGPNNPVGTMWIDLTAETFGIHGTAEPERVGKTASHGCVRLTNWDVRELARMAEKGTPVVFRE